MQFDKHRLEGARRARVRWQEAIDAGMPHGEVNDRWNSYVALAETAGKGVLQALEQEAKAAIR